MTITAHNTASKNGRVSAYVFTGKELDSETGYGYFGARYYWSETLTGWLSVDPMMDKYPNISPYNYCMWNPVRVIDPNGMDTLIFSWDYNKRRGYYVERRHGGDNNIGIIKGKDSFSVPIKTVCKHLRDIMDGYRINEMAFYRNGFCIFLSAYNDWGVVYQKDSTQSLITQKYELMLLKNGYSRIDGTRFWVHKPGTKEK